MRQSAGNAAGIQQVVDLVALWMKEESPFGRTCKMDFGIAAHKPACTGPNLCVRKSKTDVKVNP